jgi:hypothetical protein
MIRHRLGTRWWNNHEVGWCCVQFAPCTRRRGARVSWFSLKTKVDRFPHLRHKTDSCGLVIWPMKSPWWFLGLGLKTMRDVVCQLCNKSHRSMKMARDTRRDLAACFAWKQVGLGFPSLATRQAEAQCGWCTWYHCGGLVETKLKMDGSMWWTASYSSTPTLPFLLY